MSWAWWYLRTKIRQMRTPLRVEARQQKHTDWWWLEPWNFMTLVVPEWTHPFSDYELITTYLVGGLEQELNFSIYWECHHPNWRTQIFQRGKYTTNQHRTYLWLEKQQLRFQHQPSGFQQSEKPWCWAMSELSVNRSAMPAPRFFLGYEAKHVGMGELINHKKRWETLRRWGNNQISAVY